MKKFITVIALVIGGWMAAAAVLQKKQPLTFKQKWEIAIDDLFRYDQAVDNNSGDTTMILLWLEEDFDNLSPYIPNLEAHLETAYGSRGTWPCDVLAGLSYWTCKEQIPNFYDCLKAAQFLFKSCGYVIQYFR